MSPRTIDLERHDSRAKLLNDFRRRRSTLVKAILVRDLR